ncbi:MAG: efflux RND transporter periplasmic adaptor subunit [Oscillospiraceae bacterium]|nr:efflux RND transporter periplasmic adaptor subunit [Oscillospiraceae bacterium]MBR0452226.1 efflux RND transporter periplasmic adaptor subunit [Oscillospiraceae bacterium]
MNKKKKALIAVVLILVLLAGGAGAWYFLGNKSSGNAVYIMPVSSFVDFGMGVANRFSGVVEAQQTVDYQLDTSKTLKETFVKEGDSVKIGDPLFSYDTDSINLDIAQKKLDIQREQASITSNNELIAVTTDDLYRQQLRNENLQTEYRIKALRNELNSLEISLQNAYVTSSVEGTVKYVSDGTGTSNVYISVMKTGDFVIKGKVNEMNISQLSQGTKVVIKSRVDNTTWDGFVSRIDTGQTAQTEGEYYYGMDSGNQSSKYYFYVDLNSSSGLFLGQHVIVELADSSGKSGLWLYEGYIEDADSKDPYVWADNKGKITKKHIKLGNYDEEIGSWEILEGLSINDYIAFPDGTIKEGQKTTTEYVYNEPEIDEEVYYGA